MMSPTGTSWRRRALTLAAGWAWCLASQAADPVRGAALFAQAPAPGLLGCIDCHSDNPQLYNFGNIWVGRNAVALIERAVASNTGGMGYLRDYRSAADLADIAAYLGNTPGALSFPLTPLNSSSAVQTVTVRTSTKTGAGAFEARTEGDFAVRASTCGTALPRFADCSLDVVFTPTAGGSRKGGLLLSHDGTPTPVRIALDGLAPERVPAVATVLPAQLDFGTSPVGLPGALRNVTLANHSAETLTVADVQAGATPFVVTGGSCAPGTRLASGQRCTVALRFDPATAGASNGALTIVHDGVGGRATVALGGSGLNGGVPLLRASPGAVSFGVTEAGGAPVLQTITLINDGSAPLTTADLGSTGVDFTIERNGCSDALPLAPGLTCQLQVSFRPTRAGSFSAELRVAGTGLAEALRLPMYGLATAGQALLQASPGRLTYDEITGQASVHQLMIVNRGAVATRVSSLALTGPEAADFGLASGTTCQPGSVLAPGTGCSVALRFAPSSPGLHKARLQVWAGDGDTPAAAAELAGQAHAQSAPRLLLDAVALTFPEQAVGAAATGAPQQVTVYNAGREVLRWSSLQVAGDHAADFAVDGDCLLSPTLAAGASCHLRLHFTPQAAGRRSASLLLAPANGTPWALVQLSGRGAAMAAGQLSVDAPALDFGRPPRGPAGISRRVVLSNSGSGPLSITTLRTEGPFAVSPLGATCQRRLLPAEACAVELLFDTAQEGPASGRLVIESSAAPPRTVALTAEATGSGPWLDWQVLPTGPMHVATAVGEVAAGPTWTVVNRGNAVTAPLRWHIGGAAAADYSIDATSTCVAGTVLPAGGACYVRVLFHPGAGGPRVADMQLNGGNSTLTLGLEGRGSALAAGLLAAAPQAAVFQTAPGRPAAAERVLWRNEGAAVLHVQPVTLRDAAFTLSATGAGACSAEAFDLLPGQTCQVEVGWTGGAAGAGGAQLVAASDDAWGGTAVPVSVSEDPVARSNVGAGGGAAGSTPWLLALAAAVLALRRHPRTRQETESRHV